MVRRDDAPRDVMFVEDGDTVRRTGGPYEYRAELLPAGSPLVARAESAPYRRHIEDSRAYVAGPILDD